MTLSLPGTSVLSITRAMGNRLIIQRPLQRVRSKPQLERVAASLLGPRMALTRCHEVTVAEDLLPRCGWGPFPGSECFGISMAFSPCSCRLPAFILTYYFLVSPLFLTSALADFVFVVHSCSRAPGFWPVGLASFSTRVCIHILRAI